MFASRTLDYCKPLYLALLEHVRAHLVIDAGAGVTLPGSALAPDQVLRFALHCLADTVTTHHAPARAQ